MRMLASLAAAVLCVSCTHTITVSSLMDPSITAGKAYVLLPAMENVSQDDLQYKEFAAYVHGALHRRGWVKAEDPASADLAILLRYRTGDPQPIPYSVTLPQYGWTDGGTSTVYMTGKSGTVSGTVTTPGEYKQIGSTTVSGTTLYHAHFLALDAVDLSTYRSSEKIISPWQTVVVTSSSSADLRSMLPVLVAASEPYIGSNTGKYLTVSIGDSDPRVLRVRNHVQR